MTRQRRSRFVVKALLWALPGSMVLGSSCSTDVRNALTNAGTSFLSQTASEVLQALFPVADWVAAQNETA